MAKLQITSPRADVKAFLGEMLSVLSSDAFDIDRDFYFQVVRSKDDPDDPYTNENTLLTLNYDNSDVVACLKTLTLSDYSETQLDSKADDNPPKRFFVFGKTIEGRDVYIKLRLKQRRTTTRNYVFCISFHFAKHPITRFPYKTKT